MHQYFADWYSQVDLEASAERLEARWSCVEAALNALDVASILQLTRVAFGLPKPESADPDGTAITAVFKNADVSLPMKANEQLLRLLFSATLASYIEEHREHATQVSLAVLCAEACSVGASPPIAELVPSAHAHLARIGASRRDEALKSDGSISDFTEIEVPPSPETPVLHDIASVNQFGQANQNFQQLQGWMGSTTAVVDALVTSLETLRTEVAASFRQELARATLENRVKVLTEECNVLWWLFTEQADETKTPWNKLRAPDMASSIGRELASLMSFNEPPPNATAFLRKALSRMSIANEAASLRQVVEGTPDAMRATVTRSRASIRRTGAVTPVHFALNARVESSTNWPELVVRYTGLTVDSQLPPLRWAEQIYREALLIRSMERSDAS